jgi:DNA adenine methylase
VPASLLDASGSARTVPRVPQPAPFLRWAGGKRRLLPALHAALPVTIGRFYEPFLGGGALFFSLEHPGTDCVINDFTADLVACYEALRDTPDALIARLHEHARDTSKDAYLALRASEPDSPLERAARFIALNRTSFNGLYRVNGAGKFNVPWGQLKNPTVCNEELLRADAARLAGATIRTGSYADAVSDARAGDFVYFDPPYIPLSATSNFAAYAKEGFGPDAQVELATCVQDLAARGVNVMLSNSDTPLTREIFAGMNLHTVEVHRSISAKASARGTVTEVLGVTYDVSQMRTPDWFARSAA